MVRPLALDRSWIVDLWSVALGASQRGKGQAGGQQCVRMHGGPMIFCFFPKKPLSALDNLDVEPT